MGLRRKLHSWRLRDQVITQRVKQQVSRLLADDPRLASGGSFKGTALDEVIVVDEECSFDESDNCFAHFWLGVHPMLALDGLPEEAIISLPFPNRPE